MGNRESSTLQEREKIIALEQKVLSLEQQIDWFKRQLFGRKSEKSELEPNPEQPLLDGPMLDTPSASTPQSETITYTRSKQRDDHCVTDSELRFDDSVPKKTIRCRAPQLEGPDAGEYEVVSEKRTYRLAQRSASFVVLEYVHPVLKHRPSQKLSSVAAPPALWSGSIAWPPRGRRRTRPTAAPALSTSTGRFPRRCPWSAATGSAARAPWWSAWMPRRCG